MSSPPPYSTLSIPQLPAPTVRSRALRWAALGTFLFLAMGLLLLLMGAQAGLAGLILGIIMAILPVPIYIALALWLDRMEPEPPQLLALAFGWGCWPPNRKVGSTTICCNGSINTDIISVWFSRLQTIY